MTKPWTALLQLFMCSRRGDATLAAAPPPTAAALLLGDLYTWEPTLYTQLLTQRCTHSFFWCLFSPREQMRATSTQLDPTDCVRRVFFFNFGIAPIFILEV